ncbi:MAG TPA: hypothetical protein VFV71_07025 [Burkholderiales bacterium]|nr:hypothetical protein [Burkholderiales bacterium]
MLFQSGRRAWRWIAFAATVANVAFSTLAQGLSFGEGSIREIARRHADLFTPAGYAFAIWGATWLATLAYAVHQLSPSQRHVDAHDRLAVPLTVLNALAAVWIVPFRLDMVGWSAAIAVAALAAAFVLFLRVESAARRLQIDAWVRIPATLWFGWLCVAVLANFSIWLVASRGLDHEGRLAWACAALGAALLAGLLVGRWFRNGIHPLVVAWACAAIWTGRRFDEPALAWLALLGAAAMSAWAARCLLLSRRSDRGFRIFRGPLDA